MYLVTISIRSCGDVHEGLSKLVVVYLHSHHTGGGLLTALLLEHGVGGRHGGRSLVPNVEGDGEHEAVGVVEVIVHGAPVPNLIGGLVIDLAEVSERVFDLTTFLCLGLFKDSRIWGVVGIIAVFLIRKLVLLLVLLPPGQPAPGGHEGEVNPKLLEQVLPAETRIVRLLLDRQSGYLLIFKLYEKKVLVDLNNKCIGSLSRLCWCSLFPLSPFL